MEISGTLLGIETVPPLDYLCSGTASRAIDKVLSDVMRATGCAGSCVCRLIDADFRPIVSRGSIEPFERAAVSEAQEPSTPTTIGIVAERTRRSSTAMPPLDILDRTNVAFTAAVSLPGDADAMLVAFDDERKPALSPAQIYVLQAHAAHLATLFTREAPQHSDQGDGGADQQARLERLRLLESVAVHARDSIIITEAEPIDLPGPRILYCNAAFTRTTGYSADEVIGRTPRLLQGKRTDPAARARLRSALAAWEPVEIEMTNYRKDGTEFCVELSIVPVANEQGWFTHWVSVQRDVTERKEAEQLATRIKVAEFENKALALEIRERKHAEAQLLYTAFHDNLTRLRNRAFFMERLTASLALTDGAEKRHCSVLFLDLDRFKVVNDSLGHVLGDTLLKEVAKRLAASIRPQDTLARFGGDEFAILIDDADCIATPVLLAERVIEALRAPVQLGRQHIFPSCSIGIAQACCGTTSPEELIRDADIAMYEAKRAGCGDYAIFDTSMGEKAVALLALQTDLRHAVDRNEFRLVYQPIVHPATGVIAGFEALLRWQHPDHGAVSPSVFIPVAEQLGLIRQIGRWVMNEAGAQLRTWQMDHANPSLRMSINTSAAEFIDPGFISDLGSMLRSFELAPGSLELEITEGIFLYPSPKVAETIAIVRSMGVHVGLDDFGTGYSSLSYINRYPIDTIKIDKSFIDGIFTEARTRAIVELVIKLGATLGIRVVAEGIETRDQADLLASVGCDHVQGYYFAPPLSVIDAGKQLGATLRDAA